MKQGIIIGVALAIILLLNCLQSSYLDKTSKYLLTDINEIKNCIKREDFKGVSSGIEELERNWNIVKDRWDIFCDHDDVKEMTERITSVKVYASYQDIEELVNEYTLLEGLINHIIQAEKLNFSNVL